MLHRLTLRVLPGLALAVTEEAVRKRKRLVMFATGLAAFGIYRLIKHANPLADPMMLLCVSGSLAALTAIAAFRVGRQTGFENIWRQDGAQQLGWVLGWIGFVYGVQLSLMVLALLQILVHYDFLRHPDGPGMMAVIIASSSVARDAFEIGHVRWLQVSGRPVLTFPDGKFLRDLIREKPMQVIQWATIGGILCAGVAWALWALGEVGRGPVAQLVAITLIGGTVALWAYLAGVQQTGSLMVHLDAIRWSELFRFWWWPGLAFGATYYLVLAGAANFLFRMEAANEGVNALVASGVGALMAMYGYYLGRRRYQEDRIHQTVPASLLRCPFVMGILTQNGARSNPGSLATPSVALRESEGQG